MQGSAPPGRAIEIRFAQPSDAAQLLELKLALDVETTFMMYEPGERDATEMSMRQDIEARINSPNSTLIVAAGAGLIAGYVEAAGGAFNRTRHLALVTAGVRRSHAGRGLGSRLFQALVDWADQTGIRRLELTGMIHNRAAIGLYEKYGFTREGLRRCSVVVAGTCVDEIALARLHPAFAGLEPNG
jgi:RimJ/RimL family protein N-acetyltransferase